MFEYLTGSRSRCAAALCLLCVCVIATQTRELLAEGVEPDDRYKRGAALDSTIESMTNDDGTSDEDRGISGNGGRDDDASRCGVNPSQSWENEGGSSAWFGVDYLHWRLDGNRLPPLVTDGPATAPRSEVAQLGDPGTVILAGGGELNEDWRSGFRLYGGYWLDCGHTWGIGADYFNVGSDNDDFVSSQDPNRIVGRPFFNTGIGQNDLQLISVPNELDGSVEVRSNDSLQGAGVTLNRSMWCWCDPCCREVGSNVSLLGGYRFYNYDSNLNISENLTVLPGTRTPLVPGTTFLLHDSFRTRNEFNGGEIGLQAYSLRHWLWFEGLAKVALGVQQRTVTIDGATTIDVPGGGTFTGGGGLLTSTNTNIGSYDDSNFVVIPEFRLGVGAKITSWLSLRGGYNLILWNDVVRAGSSLPPSGTVDPRNLPPIQAGGGAEPAFRGIRGSQLAAQGLDAGITCQW
jgi:hypothetical protein